MEIHLEGLGERYLWLLLIVLAAYDVTRLGIVAQADDFGICGRFVPGDGSEISANIGHTLSLFCLTDFEPPQNRLTWFKNDNAIGDDDRIIITPQRVPCTLETGAGNDENCDSLQLSIFNITKDDEGLYICRGAQTENGIIFVRVVEETPATTSTLAGTTLMTPLLMKPTCSSNIPGEDVLLPNDTVMFTCMTNMYSFSAGSLDWLGHENIQMKDNNSHSTSLVIDVQTALTSHLQCHLSCDESVQNCQEEGLVCQVPLFSVSPLDQEGDVGGNVSFTCEINLKNYTVSWFVGGGADFQGDQLDIQNFNDGRTSLFTILNLQPNQTGSLFCRVHRYGVGVGTPRTVKFGVASPPDTSASTETTLGSMSEEQTTGPASPHPPTTWCVYLTPLDDIPSPPPISLTLIIIIIMAIIICIWCCRRRNHQPSTVNFNPGDLSHDNPMNMDVRLNEGARSSDIPHPYSTVIHGRHDNPMNMDVRLNEGARSSDIPHPYSTVIHGHHNGPAERTSSFVSLTEENDEDEPGRNLNLNQLNHEYACVINA